MIVLNKAIYSILSTNVGVKALVGKNIFPVIIPELTNVPAIVIERQSTPEGSKDGIHGYDCTVSITIISKDYGNAIDIASATALALNEYQGSVLGVQIIHCRLVGVNELYAEDVFFQKLSYNVKCR